MILKKMQAKEVAMVATNLKVVLTISTYLGRLVLQMLALACQHPPKKTSKTSSNRDLAVAMEETHCTRHRTIYSQ